MRSIKMLAFCAGFLVFGASAPGPLMAQEVAITGKDFESGAGDAKLAEIARQAAASGKTIIVSAPPYWQEKAIAKLHAGSAAVHLKTEDAFFENVLVRIVAAEPAKPVTEPAPRVVEAARHPRPAAEIRPPAPAVAKTTATPRYRNREPAPAPAPAPEVPAREAPPATIAKIETAPPSAAPPLTRPPTAAAPAVSTSASRPDRRLAEARRRLELGLGTSVDGTIKVEKLQKGDQIYVQGPARAVVRRLGVHMQMFWLEGALDLDRAEIGKSAPGRYRVDEPIRHVAVPTLRAMHNEPKMFGAMVPAERSSLRIAMERHFNDAKEITDRLHPDQLQYGDLFYIYRKYAVVFRRTDAGFDRYWLEGEVDLNQAGVVRDGDAYRVVSDRL